jgi:hypothetical protein
VKAQLSAIVSRLLLSVFSSASRGPVPDNHGDEEHDQGNHSYGGDGESDAHALHLESSIAGFAEETAAWRVIRLVVYPLGIALLTVHFISYRPTVALRVLARNAKYFSKALLEILFYSYIV